MRPETFDEGMGIFAAARPGFILGTETLKVWRRLLEDPPGDGDSPSLQRRLDEASEKEGGVFDRHGVGPGLGPAVALDEEIAG